jgi:hypothetical protein
MESDRISVQRLAFGVRRSPFGVWRSPFGAAFGAKTGSGCCESERNKGARSKR